MAPPGRQASSAKSCLGSKGWDGLVPWDGKKANQHKLVRIVRRQKRVLKRARYPLRGSKYANHLYTDHQHVVLLALRQHFRKSYRDFCEMIEVCTAILDELGLRRVPHWTTLHKFSKRANTRRLERLLLGFLEEARVRVLYLAVDSTGFSSTSASTYYTRVLELRKSKLGGRRRGVLTRRYLKQTVAVETRKQLIVAVKFRRGPANDSPDFVWTLKKVRPAELPVKLVVADKGYDAESNHEYAQDVLGARTAIPVRAASRPKIKMRGKRRKRQAKDFAQGEYDGHRPKVETVFSVEKRTMGSHVLARVPSQQHKELVFRAFSYNSVRMETLFLFFIEDFYKAVHKQHIYRVKLLALFGGNCWHICSSTLRMRWLCEKGEVNCAGVPVVLRGAEESYPAGAIRPRVDLVLAQNCEAKFFRAFRFFFWS